MDFSKFFICPGAQKSGTTWLYRSLRRHPSFRLPPWKEIDYLFFSEVSRTKFEKRYDKMLASGKVSPNDKKWAEIFLKPWDIKRYPRLFKRVGNHFSCDVSPIYSRMESAEIALAAEVAGGSKIVIILRNPVDRAWSHAVHTIVRKKDSAEDDDFDAQIRSFAVSQRCSQMGEYSRIVRDWRRHFGDENVFIGYFDDLSNEPVAFMNRILTFVGAPAYPEKFQNDLAVSINAGQGVPIPEDLSAELKKFYAPEIEELRTLLPSEGVPNWLRA